jgi:hypothetical protein
MRKTTPLEVFNVLAYTISCMEREEETEPSLVPVQYGKNGASLAYVGRMRRIHPDPQWDGKSGIVLMPPGSVMRGALISPKFVPSLVVMPNA